MKRKSTIYLGSVSVVTLFIASIFSSTPSVVADNTAFPDGATIATADITQVQTTLPAAPPAYTYSTSSTPGSPNHTEFANFAWRQFFYVAAPVLNDTTSPATSLPASRGLSQTGTAPNTKTFIDSGKSGFYAGGGRLVWETFAHRSEMILPKQATPQAWGLAPMYSYKEAPDYSKISSILYNNLDEASQISQNMIFFPTTAPNPYTDATGGVDPTQDQQILFEAKVNQAEYDQVRTIIAAGGTPNNPTFQLADDAIEIKAAWRPLYKADGKTALPGVNPAHYHTAEIIYYTDGGSGKPPVANTATYGLIGLHLIRKTANYPSLIFTTFEQVESLVQADGTKTGLYFVTTYNELVDNSTTVSTTATFYDGTATAALTIPGTGPVKASGTQLTKTFLAEGYEGPFAVALPSVTATPTGGSAPVTVTTVTSDVEAVNTNVQTLIKGQDPDSVWQYYQLKGVQYAPIDEAPAVPVNTVVAGTQRSEYKDYYLANIVVESSRPGIQLFKGGGVANPHSSPATTAPDIGEYPFQYTRALNNAAPVDGAITPPSSMVAATIDMGGCMGCHGSAASGNNRFYSFLVADLFAAGSTSVGLDADHIGFITRTEIKEYMKTTATKK